MGRSGFVRDLACNRLLDWPRGYYLRIYSMVLAREWSQTGQLVSSQVGDHIFYLDGDSFSRWTDFPKYRVLVGAMGD